MYILLFYPSQCIYTLQVKKRWISSTLSQLKCDIIEGNERTLLNNLQTLRNDTLFMVFMLPWHEQVLVHSEAYTEVEFY